MHLLARQYSLRSTDSKANLLLSVLTFQTPNNYSHTMLRYLVVLSLALWIVMAVSHHAELRQVNPLPNPPVQLKLSFQDGATPPSPAASQLVQEKKYFDSKTEEKRIPWKELFRPTSGLESGEPAESVWENDAPKVEGELLAQPA